jgi:hypothetical protein
MNNKQQELKEISNKFLMAIDVICNSNNISMLDKQVLMDRIKDIYDFLLTNDFNNNIEPIKEIKPEEKIEPIVEKPIVEKKEKEEEKTSIVEELTENKEKISKNEEIIKKNKEIIPEIKEEEIEPKEEVIENNDEEKANAIFESKSEEIDKQKQEIVKQIEETEKQIKELNNNTPSPSETSSVLEYLHQNVIKDIPKKEETVKEQADLFSERPTSIADRFEEKNKSDLRTAVGVSEKFMFINDLFSGNIKEYTDFINKLNEAKDIMSSMKIITETKEKRKWATVSLAYTTLETLIEKRFE